jgi:hypothetical protein
MLMHARLNEIATGEDPILASMAYKNEIKISEVLGGRRQFEPLVVYCCDFRSKMQVEVFDILLRHFV